MYSLKEAWLLMHGKSPVENWEGKIYCQEVIGDRIFQVNNTRGFISAFTFTLLLEGTSTILHDGKEMTLYPNDLFIYLPGSPVKILSVSEDYRSICLLADEQVVVNTPAGHDMMQIAYLPIMRLHEPKMSMSSDSANHLARRMREISEYLHSNHIYRYEVLKMLYTIFLLDLQNAQSETIVTRKVPQRMEDIFMSFMRLLSAHFVEHHDIGFYASQLNISTVYLSRVVRQVSGRTVVGFIDYMLSMEAAYLLHTSSLSITQIADRLHFASISSFSKFFSRMKGCTPREFRERG